MSINTPFAIHPVKQKQLNELGLYYMTGRKFRQPTEGG